MPAGPAYYYLFPFIHTFLGELGVDFVVERSTEEDLRNLHLCPADDPCISIKVVYPEVKRLLEKGVDYVLVPSVISTNCHNYYCPKIMGLPWMIRAGIEGSQGKILSPIIDVKDSPGKWERTWIAAARALEAVPPNRAKSAVRNGLRAVFEAESKMADMGLTPVELLGSAGFAPRLRDSGQPGAKNILVLGHRYVLYEPAGRRIMEYVSRMCRLLVAEHVSPEKALHRLDGIFEGLKLWQVEGHLLGAGLELMNTGGCDAVVFVSVFSCGPLSVVESFLERDAARLGIPFLKLVVDEHSGDAGLITRLEAFLDTVSTRHALGPAPELAKPLLGEVCGRGKVGAVVMGDLDIPIRSLFAQCGEELLLPEKDGKMVEHGRELAPEFICYPMVVLLGQVRRLVEKGADRILMIQGKGKCRLGWYAQVMENLLNEAGYPVRIVAVDSPLPFETKWRQFAENCREVLSQRSVNKIIKGAALALFQTTALDRAREYARELRATEVERGLADSILKEFVEELSKSASFSSSLGACRRMAQKMRDAPRISERPLQVVLSGEIYVINEPFANLDVEELLGSLGVRVRVHKSMDVTGWLKCNLFRTPDARRQYRARVENAVPYLGVHVGGHGQESVGEAVLSKVRGMDGLIHLYPFTCMPEIIASSVLSKFSKDTGFPVLSLVMSEQEGRAGFQTRIEAFCETLYSRRAKSEVRK